VSSDILCHGPDSAGPSIFQRIPWRDDRRVVRYFMPRTGRRRSLHIPENPLEGRPPCRPIFMPRTGQRRSLHIPEIPLEGRPPCRPIFMPRTGRRRSLHISENPLEGRPPCRPIFYATDRTAPVPPYSKDPLGGTTAVSSDILCHGPDGAGPSIFQRSPWRDDRRVVRYYMQRTGRRRSLHIPENPLEGRPPCRPILYATDRTAPVPPYSRESPGGTTAVSSDIICHGPDGAGPSIFQRSPGGTTAVSSDIYATDRTAPVPPYF